jgi:hypothetical protein
MHGAGENMHDFVEGMRETGNKENQRNKFKQHIICNYCICQKELMN